MAETLGSLCDKLTIVKLKQFHSKDHQRLQDLGVQESQLKYEIDEFVARAVAGHIPPELLKFTANKVYKKEGNEITPLNGDETMGFLVSKLAEANCKLWNEQDKVYDFEAVPVDEKNKVVKQLALLNLERNQCIDVIDRQFQQRIKELQGR